jgi:CubicO group peptidase (beta-lactamase class C family)
MPMVSAARSRMSRIVLVLLLPVLALRAQQVEIPDTPAGRQFSRWLAAFNGADRERLRLFMEGDFPTDPMTLDEELAFRDQSGGFDVRKIEEATSTRLSGVIQGRDTGNYARFVLEVEAGEGHRVTSLSIRRIKRPSDITPPARMTEADALDALRREVEQRTARDRFAGAVLVGKDGKALFAQAYGLADRGKQIPNTVETRFRLGSMNKSFTALAVAQLAENGRLSIDRPVRQYLPDYPNGDLAQRVTIRHLLNHTGGTDDIFGPAFDKSRQNLRTLRDYLALYGTRPLKFEPGTRWEYSNYGYVLLGVIIEVVSGQTYYDYVRQHIYEPAGMTKTDALPESDAIRDRAVGYTRGQDGWVPNTAELPYRGTSAGGGYSTVHDLLRFADGLRRHTLLGPASMSLLTTGTQATPDGSKYGFGFFDVNLNGVRYFGHGGGAPGMNAELRVFRDSGYTVIVLANVDPPAATILADYISDRLPSQSR